MRRGAFARFRWFCLGIRRTTRAGATFPAQIYRRWFGMISGNNGLKFIYQANVSGSGRKAYLDQTVNFGASDDPMISRDRRKVKRGVVQIPMIGSTISFGDIKPGCELKLTQDQAVKVAMSAVKDWSELGCPLGPINWVHRSDGSETTKALTSSMAAFSSSWTLGTCKAVNWPRCCNY